MAIREKVVTLADAEEYIAELEAEISELEEDLGAYEGFDDSAAFYEVLLEDRERLLAAVGVTEHEWWCHGGARLRDVLEDAEERARKKADAREGAPVGDVELHSVPKEPEEEVPPLPDEDDEIPPLPEEAAGFFSSVSFDPDSPLTAEQEVAFDEVVEWYERSDETFYSLTGPAGTGKTFLTKKLAEHFSNATLCAMTGKAALRVSEMTGRGASTLHSVLYWPPKPGEDLRFTRLREALPGLVIVDESSQMTPAVKKDLARWGEGVRVLLVGDGFQLPPVITGKELEEYGESYSVFGEVEGASLKTVMRNAGGVLRAATRVRETGEMCTVSDMDGNGEGYTFARYSDPVERAVKSWLDDQDDHLLISWRNAVRMGANRKIRAALGHGGPLPDEGEPVLIRRNGQGFLNGEIVVCRGFEEGPEIGSLQTLWMGVQGGGRVLVTVAGGKEGEMMDGGSPWIADWRRYHADLRRLAVPEPTPISFGYVCTAHSAQGSESRRVTVFLAPGDERSTHFRKTTTLPDGSQASFAARFLYTAQTRGKKLATLMVGR